MKLKVVDKVLLVVGKAQYNQCIFVNFSCTFYETEEENSAEKCVT